VATVVDIDTPHGPARAHVHKPRGAKAALVLGHGAGGSVDAKDLVVVRDAGLELGYAVVLVEQPYRVAGRKAAAPAPQLDAAWTTVIAQLSKRRIKGLPLIVGGRSSGARVACRTAADTGAAGVLCLAFPVHPPGRPEKSRLGELDAVKVPVLVIQGESDPFGMPPKRRGRTLAGLRGNHSLTADLDGVAAAAGAWLSARL
jgi:predicted alpha/beta-hydrolase family hydrolase